jgi:hypothetical protein
VHLPFKSREEWMEELRRRQDNIDPIQRIANGASFQGSLVNGSLPLNKTQRVGALIIGVFSLTIGCVGLAELAAALESWRTGSTDVSLSIFSPIALWVGWKTTTNAIINNPKKRAGKEN